LIRLFVFAFSSGAEHAGGLLVGFGQTADVLFHLSGLLVVALLLLFGAQRGLGLAASARSFAQSTQMERDEIPQHPHLQTADAQQTVQSDEGGVVVAGGAVDVGDFGESQSVPERQHRQRDAAQTHQDEEDVVELESGTGDALLFGEVRHATDVEDQLRDVVQQQDAQRHSREVESVSSADEHEIHGGVDGSGSDLVLLRLLEVELGELMEPVRDLNQEE